jgi:hypothetical protein
VQRRNNVNDFKDFYLKAKARIGPRLSFMCHICLAADSAKTIGAMRAIRNPLSA